MLGQTKPKQSPVTTANNRKKYDQIESGIVGSQKKDLTKTKKRTFEH